MYKRCISDAQNLEPRKLFNLVEFLMYDKNNSGTITEEDTLQLLFVRHGREKLDEEIRAVFGEQQARTKTDEGEKTISYPVYVTKVNKRAMDERREAKKAKKQNALTDKD